MSNTAKKITTFDITITGLFAALCFVFYVVVPRLQLPLLGKGGLVHFGDVPFVIAAIIFGRKKGALAGGIGLSIGDLITGFAIWSPFTLVIKFAMGYGIGKIASIKQGQSLPFNVFAIIVGGVINCVGYYFTEVIIYGNWYTPFASIPGNWLQIALVLVVGIPIITVLNKNSAIKTLIKR